MTTSTYHRQDKGRGSSLLPISLFGGGFDYFQVDLEKAGLKFNAGNILSQLTANFQIKMNNQKTFNS